MHAHSFSIRSTVRCARGSWVGACSEGLSHGQTPHRQTPSPLTRPPALKHTEPNERLSRQTRRRGPVCGRVRGVSMERHASIVIDTTRNLPLDPHDRSSERVELSTLARAPCASSIDGVHRLPPSRISTPRWPPPLRTTIFSPRRSLPRSEPAHVPPVCSCHCTSTAVYRRTSYTSQQRQGGASEA